MTDLGSVIWRSLGPETAASPPRATTTATTRKSLIARTPFSGGCWKPPGTQESTAIVQGIAACLGMQPGFPFDFDTEGILLPTDLLAIFLQRLSFGPLLAAGGVLRPRRLVGVASVLKKIVRLHRFFLHQISLESKLNGRQKVKGGNGSISASISTSLIASLITLNLGVGCAPSCWPIFGFRNLLGARRGTEGSFLCSPSSRFSGRGGGWGRSASAFFRYSSKPRPALRLSSTACCTGS